MHNKIIHSIKKSVFLIVFFLATNLAFSQHYIGLSKEDVKMIFGKDYTVKDGVFMYDTPALGGFGKGTEFFYFDEKEKVKQYWKLGAVYQDEIIKIVKYNNANFKRISAGEKQNFFQWIDPKDILSFRLEVIPIDKNLSIIDYVVVKEH